MILFADIDDESKKRHLFSDMPGAADLLHDLLTKPEDLYDRLSKNLYYESQRADKLLEKLDQINL